MRLLILGLMLLSVKSACAAARPMPLTANVPANPLTVERVAALPAMDRAPWEEYLQRSAQQRQVDRATFATEMKAAGLQQALTPPGGRGLERFLRDRPEDWYKTAEAQRIADVVVSYQTPAGGWGKNLDETQHARRKGEQFGPDNNSRFLNATDNDLPADAAWHYIGTFDNDATSTELRFLAKVITAVGGVKSEAYRQSFLRGLEYIFAAQYPNGGWPQVWPLEGGYHDAITYNDGVMTNLLAMLRAVAEGQPDFQFVPATARVRAAAAVRRGVSCVLACQIVQDGRRTVWCQQHDALTLQPASARNYEMPSMSSSESAGIVNFLMELPHPDENVVAAVQAAVIWFKATAIQGERWGGNGPEGRHIASVPGAPALWSRYYELGTDRPIFGDRDKSIHYDVKEISAERRNGYAWYNNSALVTLERYEVWHRTFGARGENKR